MDDATMRSKVAVAGLAAMLAEAMAIRAHNVAVRITLGARELGDCESPCVAMAQRYATDHREAHASACDVAQEALVLANQAKWGEAS